MLRRFNVKNFMSFTGNESGVSDEFSMIPGKVRSKPDHIYKEGKLDMMKFAAIYGANASGKSNLVKAISCMREIVLTGETVNYRDKYSKIGTGNEMKPSYFEVELLLDGRIYSYGFEVVLSTLEFVSEWLVKLSRDGQDSVIFERDITNHDINVSKEWRRNDELYTRLSIYIEDTPTLFLNTINRINMNFYLKNGENADVMILRKVYKWFEESLNINGPDKPVYGHSFFTTMENVRMAIDILNSYDTGITRLDLKEVEASEIENKISDSRSADVLDAYREKVSEWNEMVIKNALRSKSIIEKELESYHLNKERKNKRRDVLKSIDKMFSLFDPKLIQSVNKKYFDEIMVDSAEELDNAMKESTNDTKKIQNSCIGIHGRNNLFISKVFTDKRIVNYEVRTKHSDDNTFTFGEESDGTKRLWDILEVLMTAKNTTFIIDEIDRCMHPALTYKFIRDFLRVSAGNNVQLIVTTHESRLLNNDLLRRDEVWLVDKRDDGSSGIYSLDEFKERNDTKLDKAYLEGRYGGVPIFTSFFPYEEEEQ